MGNREQHWFTAAELLSLKANRESTRAGPASAQRGTPQALLQGALAAVRIAQRQLLMPLPARVLDLPSPPAVQSLLAALDALPGFVDFHPLEESAWGVLDGVATQEHPAGDTGLTHGATGAGWQQQRTASRSTAGTSPARTRTAAQRRLSLVTPATTDRPGRGLPPADVPTVHETVHPTRVAGDRPTPALHAAGAAQAPVPASARATLQVLLRQIELLGRQFPQASPGQDSSTDPRARPAAARDSARHRQSARHSATVSNPPARSAVPAAAVPAGKGSSWSGGSANPIAANAVASSPYRQLERVVAWFRAPPTRSPGGTRGAGEIGGRGADTDIPAATSPDPGGRSATGNAAAAAIPVQELFLDDPVQGGALRPESGQHRSLTEAEELVDQVNRVLREQAMLRGINLS